MSIELHILLLLRAAGNLMTPEITLRMDLRSRMVPAPRLADVNEAFNKLEDRGFAVSIRDDLDDSVRWRITDTGKAELAERGY